jgi:hypothetical protein
LTLGVPDEGYSRNVNLIWYLHFLLHGEFQSVLIWSMSRIIEFHTWLKDVQFFIFFFCQVEEPISSVNYEKVNIIKIKIHLLSLYTYTFVLLHGISDISTKLNYLILSLTLNIYYVDLLFFTILCLQLFKQKVMTSYL